MLLSNLLLTRTGSIKRKDMHEPNQSDVENIDSTPNVASVTLVGFIIFFLVFAAAMLLNEIIAALNNNGYESIFVYSLVFAEYFLLAIDLLLSVKYFLSLLYRAITGKNGKQNPIKVIKIFFNDIAQGFLSFLVITILFVFMDSFITGSENYSIGGPMLINIFHVFKFFIFSVIFLLMIINISKTTIKTWGDL